MSELERMTMVELQFRRALANFAIRTCVAEGDPHGVVEKYRAQARRINGALKAKMRDGRNGAAKPPTQQIGLKPGRLSARKP